MLVFSERHLRSVPGRYAAITTATARTIPASNDHPTTTAKRALWVLGGMIDEYFHAA